MTYIVHFELNGEKKAVQVGASSANEATSWIIRDNPDARNVRAEEKEKGDGTPKRIKLSPAPPEHQPDKPKAA